MTLVFSLFLTLLTCPTLCALKLVNTPHSPSFAFGVLTRRSPYLPECEFFSCSCLLSVSSPLPFSELQTLISKLVNKVLSLCYHPIVVLLTHFQLPEPLSRDHVHHTMIGTFLSYPLAISNIQNSDYSHIGAGLPCVIARDDSSACFGRCTFPL